MMFSYINNETYLATRMDQIDRNLFNHHRSSRIMFNYIAIYRRIKYIYIARNAREIIKRESRGSSYFSILISNLAQQIAIHTPTQNMLLLLLLCLLHLFKFNFDFEKMTFF